MPVRKQKGWTTPPEGTYTPSSANASEWIRQAFPLNISPMSQSMSSVSERHSLPDDSEDFVRWYDGCVRALRESGLESELSKMRSEVFDVFIKYEGISAQKQVLDKMSTNADSQVSLCSGCAAPLSERV